MSVLLPPAFILHLPPYPAQPSVPMATARQGKDGSVANDKPPSYIIIINSKTGITRQVEESTVSKKLQEFVTHLKQGGRESLVLDVEDGDNEDVSDYFVDKYGEFAEIDNEEDNEVESGWATLVTRSTQRVACRELCDELKSLIKNTDVVQIQPGSCFVSAIFLLSHWPVFLPGFVASRSFAGVRKGYAFRTGLKGLGYYRDKVQQGALW